MNSWSNLKTLYPSMDWYLDVVEGLAAFSLEGALHCGQQEFTDSVRIVHLPG